MLFETTYIVLRVLKIKGVNKKCILSFFVVIRQTSTAANKNKCEWAVRQSTAHPHFFCRALYLQPSNNKLACPGNAHLRSVNCAFSHFASLENTLFIKLSYDNMTAGPKRLAVFFLSRELSGK